MKRRGMLGTMVLVVCFVIMGICFLPNTVSAKQNTAISQIKGLAKKQVKGAKIVKVSKDDEDGEPVYEVELLKGKNEYELVYRASDYKLISYGREMKSRYVKKGKGKIISESKVKKLAKKQVKDADIVSIAKKRSSGVDVYKVKMKNDSKKYELKLHARTGKVLEYDWELVAKAYKGDKDSKNNTANKKNKDKDNKNKGNKDKDNNSNKDYIGEESAKQIAFEEVGGGTVSKIEFDMDDGIPVYEVEMIEGKYEYEIKIHAETGIVLNVEREYKPNLDDSEQDSEAGNTGDYIGLEQAKQIALESVGAGRVVKAEFDMEDGQPIYEVEIKDGMWEYELEIHAVTGNILKSEVELDD